MNRAEESHEEQMEASNLLLSQSVERRNFLAKSLLVSVSVMGLDFLGGYSPVSAAATTAQEQLSTTAITAGNQRSALTSQLHVCNRATDGQIYHTIRYPNGTWASNFGNVNNQESNGSRLRFTDVDCAGIGSDLHVTALARNGVIWHTIRYANGSWQSSYGNVNNQESNGGSLRFNNVGCASIGENLHLTAVGTDGNIWHTIRYGNGGWQSSYGNVNNQESNGGGLSFIDVDCANVGDTLHVTAIDRQDIDWHTIRYADGTWAPSYGNINNQEGNGGSLRLTAVGAGGIV